LGAGISLQAANGLVRSGLIRCGLVRGHRDIMQR
jgi:hypothetical protein